MKKVNIDKINLILDYKQGIKLKLLSEKYLCDSKTIKKILVSEGCYIEPHKKNICEDEISSIINDYNNRITGGELSKKYSISRKRIMEVLKNNGAVYHSNHKYDFNRRFFEKIDTEKKAYWLGFIYADGSIYKSNDNVSNHLVIKLSSKDKGHLDKFKNDFNLPHDIKLRKENGFGGGFESARIRITSKELVNDLIGHGCVPNKTFIIQFPQIDETLYNHFIRGYFDGDGCISTTDNQNQITILGNYDFLSSIQNILIEKCKLNKTKISKKNKVYSLHYGGNLNSRKFGDFLYNNYTTCLERKHMVFYKNDQELSHQDSNLNGLIQSQI
jgi:hypothetical protein